jgi:hypothetical protein
MTPDQEKRQATAYRIMTWTSANRRTLRGVVLALGMTFLTGVLLLFWSPSVGLLMMSLAALPLVLVLLLVGVALVFNGERGKGR